NFSFVRLYEVIVNAISTRFAFVGKIPERFKAWRLMRAERARLKKETKAAIKAEREAAKSTLKQTLGLTPAERVADFMKEPVAPASEAPPAWIETKQVPVEAQPTAVAASASAAGAGVGVATPPATVVTGRSGRRSIFPMAEVEEEESAEEMVKGASV